jgi:hypothetical protein
LERRATPPSILEIQAELEGKPVQLKIEYLDKGPFYAVHTVISTPKKDRIIDIEMFDYSNSGQPQ